MTLFEVLVVTVISVMAGGMLLTVMSGSVGLFYKESSKVSQGLGSNDALNVFRKNLKGANSVVLSYTNGSTTYNSGANQLVLTLPSLDGNGDIIQNSYDRFVYIQDQNILRLKIFPDAQSQRKQEDQVLATFVGNVIFQYFNNAVPPSEVEPALAVKVRMTLTLNQKAGANFEQTIATSEANLRND